MTLKKLKQMHAVRVPFQLMTTATGNSRTEHRRTSDWIPCQLVWTFSSLKNGTRDVDSHKNRGTLYKPGDSGSRARLMLTLRRTRLLIAIQLVREIAYVVSHPSQT